MRMVNVKVPKYAVVGTRERLHCNYTLGKENLYSVKWYKDGSEFYRYITIKTHKIRKFYSIHTTVSNYSDNII